MDERTLGAVVFLVLLAISVAGLFWSSRQADRLDAERRQRRTLASQDTSMIGRPL